MPRRSRSRSRSRRLARRSSRRLSRRMSRRLSRGRRLSRRLSRRRSRSRGRPAVSKRALVATANDVVANADPVDVERAAGNGTPTQVAASRSKLASRVVKALPYAGALGLAGAAGIGGTLLAQKYGHKIPFGVPGAKYTKSPYYRQGGQYYNHSGKVVQPGFLDRFKFHTPAPLTSTGSGRAAFDWAPGAHLPAARTPSLMA